MFKKDSSPLTVLPTKRLKLRGLEISDAEAIAYLRSNSEVNKFLDRSSKTSIEGALTFIKTIQKSIHEKTSYYWAITLKDSGVLIGTICYWNIAIEESTAEIGYELLPSFQGKGIMSEALKAVVDYGFDELKWQKIIAYSRNDNMKSNKLLEKTGFNAGESPKNQQDEDMKGYSLYVLIK